MWGLKYWSWLDFLQLLQWLYAVAVFPFFYAIIYCLILQSINAFLSMTYFDNQNYMDAKCSKIHMEFFFFLKIIQAYMFARFPLFEFNRFLARWSLAHSSEAAFFPKNEPTDQPCWSRAGRAGPPQKNRTKTREAVPVCVLNTYLFIYFSPLLSLSPPFMPHCNWLYLSPQACKVAGGDL